MPIDLKSHLAQLETAQLVRRVVETEPAFIFKHALTQETVYQSVLRHRRREIHRLVAQAYEVEYGNQCLDEYAAILAQHYAQAGDDAKEFEYSWHAADVAMRMNANVEATMYFGRAIEIAKRPGVETHDYASLQNLYLKRGRAFELCGQYDAALNNYIEMESLAREHQDPAMELGAMLARATLHTIPTPMQNLAQGKELLDRALVLARTLQDHAAEAKTLWNLMLIEYFFGQQARSVEIGEQALAIARKFDLREQMAYILNDIGRSYIGVGRIDDATAALEQAREFWQAQGNLPMLADNLATAEENAVWAGDYAQAKAFADQALKICQSTGNLWNQAYVFMTLSEIYLDEGNYRAAIDAMNETMQLSEQTGFAAATWFSRVNLAFLYGELGMPARGLVLFESHLDQALTTHNAFQTWCLGVLAYLNLLMGMEDEFQRLLQEAQRDANRDDLINMAPVILTLLESTWAIRQREFASAERMACALLEKYNATNLHGFKSDILLLAARALRAQNKTDAAREMFHQARDEAETVGVRRVLWEILADWSELEIEAGNVDQAQAFRAQARDLIDFISAHTPDDLRQAFLILPKVKSILEREPTAHAG